MVKGGWEKAKKPPRMRRKTVRFEEVSRDGAGNVTMLRLYPYKDNPLAPEALVSKVGGIYRVDTHLIRVTFIDEVPDPSGEMVAIAKSHLVWKTEEDWLATREIFDFVMEQFRKGSLQDDGGGRRKKMQ
jgi:hypothetical protein